VHYTSPNAVRQLMAGILPDIAFLVYITAFAFVLFWFPDYIWTSLSTFAFITWIVPHNQKVNTLFGVGARLKFSYNNAHGYDD
jgi:OPT oligopeptide transporter protein.